MGELRELLREQAASVTPSPDWHESVVRRAARRSRRRRIEAGIVASALAIAAVAVSLRAFGSDTPAVPANDPAATAEPSGNYVFHDVGIKESTPHHAKISYWVSWSSGSFPGIHRCTWTAFGEDGDVVGEFTENISETDPPPRSADATFGLSVTDTAVSASIVCDPERLDTGTPYLHEFEILEVNRRPISEESISWDISLHTRWLGQGHPGVSDCRVSITDREDKVVFTKPVTFSGELYPDTPTFSWFVNETPDTEREPVPPYNASFSCRPFGSDGPYEPAPEVARSDD